MKELCPKCEVAYSNAAQDASKQQQQAEAAITNGAKVIVLDPVDSTAASAIANRAAAQNIPVVAYDRLVKDADIDYYISFNNEEVGKLQGNALLKKLQDDGTVDKGQIVMINGSPTDNNAADFKKGALSVLQGKVKIGKEYDTPEWSADQAQREMEQAITAIGKANIVGVYAANDGTAGGAIAAMTSAGFNPIPPTTGQDAEIAGLQRIVAGTQYMTVYKPIKPEAEDAAILAYALLTGKAPSGVKLTTVNNGKKDVKSVILTPIAVTQQNLKDTVIKDGFHKASEICTEQYAAACQKLGIS
jgi:D-xylose transport system substrate-binding protein